MDVKNFIDFVERQFNSNTKYEKDEIMNIILNSLAAVAEDTDESNNIFCKMKKSISYFCLNDEHLKCKYIYFNPAKKTIYGEETQNYICNCKCHLGNEKNEAKKVLNLLYGKYSDRDDENENQ